MCPVCMDQPEHIVITRCTHMFCRSCVLYMFAKSGGKRSFCPLCRSSLKMSDIYSQRESYGVEKMKSKIQGEWNMPSKVSALLSLLRKSDLNRKIVVFSQFQKMVAIVSGELSEAGFNVKCMNVTDRAKTKATVCEEFIIAESPLILVTTFKAMSNMPRLDLSSASSVYLMEPCWNVHAEDEALSHFYHLRKEGDVRIIRLVCKNSIEERVLKAREVKQQYYGSFETKREVNVIGPDWIAYLLGVGMFCGGLSRRT